MPDYGLVMPTSLKSPVVSIVVRAATDEGGVVDTVASSIGLSPPTSLLSDTVPTLIVLSLDAARIVGSSSVSISPSVYSES
jgi:hypothetical protein